MTFIPPAPTTSPGELTASPIFSPASYGPSEDNELSSHISCDDQVQTVVSLYLEVETAFGNDTFATEVATALKEALANEYSFCDSPLRKQRQLQGLVLLGKVVVVEEGGKYGHK